MVDKQRVEKKIKVAQVFRPGAPVDSLSLFAGRTKQLAEIINTVAQIGQHAILYGERGVGKTSLANVLGAYFFDERISEKYKYARVNCDSQDSFSTIWHKALRELKVSLEKRSMGFLEKDGKEQVRLENYLPETVHPEDVRYLLERAGNTIIVFDEIDRMSDKSATTLLADTIKTLSDHLVKATLVLVGVADSVEELLAEHRSIERSLKQVQMPRMSAEELAEILEKCLAQVKMKIKGKAKERIAQLSQGMPHYTHLLGLHAAQAAVDADRNTVTKKDVEKAIRLAVENAQHGMLSAYLKAVSSPKKNLYAQVLLACALTPTDELGYFAPAQVRAPLSSVLGKSVEIATFAKHLNEFCESERGAALQRSGSSRNYRYRFSNPMMQPFVVMNGLSKGWITEDILERTASERT